MPSSLLRSLVFLAIAALAGVLPFGGPIQAQPFRGGDSDVLHLSPADLAARDTAVRVLAGPAAAGEGERVSYRAFNGKVYPMTRYSGLYVDVLLPHSWTRPGALPAEKIRAFVDRIDVTYQHFLDLVGAHPGGKGRLPVALVPDACGGALGCANLGLKGLEMYSGPELRPSLWQEIDDDIVSGILVHELTHNFDLFSSYVAYAPDYPHAWTSFLSYYYFSYAREGFVDFPTEDIEKQWVETSGRYFRDPTANWRRCVRDGRCEDKGITSELAWGGFAYRLALLDGPQAIRGFLAYLRGYRQSHQPPPTVEAKNDLYVEALSAGARRNLSCVVDAWRWPISDSLRERLGRRHPAPNPDCQDRDLDGFSPLQGDCNDRRATVHPGAVEQLPGVDEDCDGHVDEEIWRAPAGGDFAEPPQLTLPAEVHATSGGWLDEDIFRFNLDSPGRVWFEACASRDGAVTLFDGTGTPRQVLYLLGGQCLDYVYPLEAGTWEGRIGLAGDTDDAPYSISIENGAPWPPPPWAQTAPPLRQGSGFALTATSLLSKPPGPGAEVRFWVSGRGFVGKVPYTEAAEFIWTPPPGRDPVAEGLTYRAQLLVRGVPAYVITRPQSFAP
jgi:Putative metal-binding motif